MFAGRLDLTLFVLYLLFNIGLGIWVARRTTGGARDYFLAGDRLPWYAIGASIIAANISTEHFIGMVGTAYVTGFMLAHWEWGNWFTFSVLIWIFLPYYMRGGIYTMPEFLERRYNRTCRYLFAICSLVIWIVAQMAVVMLAGAKALKGMFDIDPFLTIVGLAVLAGSYTIYGGLISVAWTDTLQFVVIMIGGLVVAIIGLDRVGGPFALMHAMPEKFKLLYPATDKDFPWLGVYSAALSIGIWYNCTNQFIVQRCLGARSEWDSRMGVIFAGYVQAVLPLLVVIPGIIAFRLYPGLADPDQAYPKLVKELIPLGLGGIVMAGLASGLMSHLSSVLNSASTVFTMDLYRPLVDRRSSDAGLVLVGRISSFFILTIATLLALWFTRGQHSVFLLLQDVGAWVAAPVSVLFLLGVLWRRATTAAAVTVLLIGFPYTWLVQSVLFKYVDWMKPYDNWLNRTFLVWLTCMALMIAVSLVTAPPEHARIKDIIWSPRAARLPLEERKRNRGVRNMFLWWAIMVGIILSMYLYMFWFQFLGPGKGH
jgi:SSS family solute:Na+ symporter